MTKIFKGFKVKEDQYEDDHFEMFMDYRLLLERMCREDCTEIIVTLREGQAIFKTSEKDNGNTQVFGRSGLAQVYFKKDAFDEAILPDAAFQEDLGSCACDEIALGYYHNRPQQREEDPDG